MDRMAGLALAGTGIAAGGRGVAAATGNLPVSKQQQLEELKAQGITPTPEQEKEARDEQLAMWGTIALAMGGGVGLGIGGDQALEVVDGGFGGAGGPGVSPYGGQWPRGADGAPVPPPGGSGPLSPGGSRMAADPATVELVSKLAAFSPEVAGEVQAILDRKAGIAPPLRVEATRHWAPATDLMENLSGIDLPEHWRDTREAMLRDAEAIEAAQPDVFGPKGYLANIANSGVLGSEEALRDLRQTIENEYDDIENQQIGIDIAAIESGDWHRTYLIPRNKNIPNDIETAIDIPVRVDPATLNELKSGEADGRDFMNLWIELDDRRARNAAGDDTYWGPENPYVPPSDASRADRLAYREYDQRMTDWHNQANIDLGYNEVSRVRDILQDSDLWGVSKGLYGGVPQYNQPDPPRGQGQGPRRRGAGR